MATEPSSQCSRQRQSLILRYSECREWSLPSNACAADDSCQISRARVAAFAAVLRSIGQDMTSYLVVALGSALGGLLRFALTRLTIPFDSNLPYGTILINLIGSFVIGFYGTLTLEGSRFQASQNMRLFVMVGICGGFTTFSAFTLQTFDLARNGSYGRALINVGLSVVLCFGAVALGHHLAQRGANTFSIAETAQEEFTG